MYKNNHGVFLTQAVSHILTEIKFHQQLVHRELGMIFKPLEPGHHYVCLGRGVVRAQPGQRSTL